MAPVAGGRGSVLAVVGASGGLGASALAAAVAVRARRAGVEAVLVDGCPWGGGLDVTVGAEQEAGIRWSDLVALKGAADGRALVTRLPSVGGVPVLSFDRTGTTPDADVVAAVLDSLVAVRRLVVVDVPPAGVVADPALAVADRVVVLAGPGLRQLAALSVVAPRLRSSPAEVVVCLRGPSGSAAGPVASVVETELGISVLAVVDEDRAVGADLVNGLAPGARGRGPLSRAADEVLGWSLLTARGAA